MTKALRYIWMALLAGCNTTSGVDSVSPAVHALPSATIVHQSTPTTVPLTLRYQKLYVDVIINHQPVTMVLDTGSPTIIDKQLADQLGLQTLSLQTGLDGNRLPISMEKAMLHEMTLGNIEITDFPVLIHDFQRAPVAKCIIENGVIGADLLPYFNWQFDVQQHALTIAPRSVPFSTDGALWHGELVDAGYPHYPIVKYGVGEYFVDNALLDTGFGGLLHINQLAAEAIGPHSMIAQGFGQLMQSAGGATKNNDYQQIALENMTIAGKPFANLESWIRPTPPTLVGIQLFVSHRLTLDYQNNRISLSPNDVVPPVTPNWGMRLYFDKTQLKVSFVEAGGIADNANIRLGDTVLSINEWDFTPATKETLCSHFDALWHQLNQSEITLKLRREQDVSILKLNATSTR
ncbi:retropepsin-like aspartic protease [Thaumasiovibrio subtropicus]|uniref:retropepsin-like aspartic protease n=1 Tax=Thaumasiovibrio subtropicus TaxID=1891207 RepID=UPI000B35F61F|nr:aspartyl protease family protein [Thaumasiovibrio subtropicus]